MAPAASRQVIDSSGGADEEAYGVVALEDDGDFFLSVCWALLPNLDDELFFGLALLVGFAGVGLWRAARCRSPSP